MNQTRQPSFVEPLSSVGAWSGIIFALSLSLSLSLSQHSSIIKKFFKALSGGRPGKGVDLCFPLLVGGLMAACKGAEFLPKAEKGLFRRPAPQACALIC
jgi:hypothetical protein